MQTTYLGIDFGTTGCRACIIDGSGTVLAEAAEPLPQPLRNGECVEQDPSLWWGALERLITALPGRFRAQLKSMAIDGTSGTVLLADRDGTPITPALMYNDARAPGEPRGQWLLQHHPEAAQLHSQADWLIYHLTRRHVCDSNNALKLGWDAEAGHWLAGGPLPEVVDAGTPLGTITPEMSAHFGLPDDLTICAGTTDSTAAFIASGATQPGEAVTALGSTLVLKVISEQPLFAPEYGIYSQPLGDLWLVGGASNCGGAVLRQFFTDEQMAAMTPQLKPEQPTGLDYYPLPSPGERFPINDPTLTPRLEPRPESDIEFFQGILEGIARIEKAGYDKLAELGAPYPTSIRSNGGGARNRGWTKIREGLLGIPMVEALQSEASFGTALLARDGLSKV
ncbi:MAG: FGGY-family carbohydrate kinase [Chromatiales bacterium]|nr:FGGY-family carbohydrate kinase [Chromatiales bacterium]